MNQIPEFCIPKFPFIDSNILVTTLKILVWSTKPLHIRTYFFICYCESTVYLFLNRPRVVEEKEESILFAVDLILPHIYTDLVIMEACSIGHLTGDPCHKGSSSDEHQGLIAFTYLSASDQELVEIRTMRNASDIETLCKYHSRKYLQFYERNQSKCSDPFMCH